MVVGLQRMDPNPFLEGKKLFVLCLVHRFCLPREELCVVAFIVASAPPSEPSEKAHSGKALGGVTVVQASNIVPVFAFPTECTRSSALPVQTEAVQSFVFRFQILQTIANGIVASC